MIGMGSRGPDWVSDDGSILVASNVPAAQVSSVARTDTSKIMPVTKSTLASRPTSQWQRVQRDHLDFCVLLQRVTEVLHELTEEPVDVGDTEADLRATAELGFSRKTTRA